MRRPIFPNLLIICCVWVAPIWADVNAIPAGAMAYYDFGDPSITSSIPNLLQAGDLNRPGTLIIKGTDFEIANGRTEWNKNLDENFTFVFPYDSSIGTFAEEEGSFPNDFPDGGTIAFRFQMDPHIAQNLGQASSASLYTFQPDPSVNIHSVPPRTLEIRRDNPTKPLMFLVREGDNSIGHNNDFNDELRSAPLLDPTADTTVIVVWDPDTIRIYLNGALSATNPDRVTADNPIPRYHLMVAVQPGLIHGGDNQFFRGATQTLVIYNRVLDEAEITQLNQALNSNGPIPKDDIAPAPPMALRLK